MAALAPSLGTGFEAEAQQHQATAAKAGDASDPRSAALAEATTTLKGQLGRLKPWTILAFVALLLIVLAFAAWHWQLMLITLALLAPTLGRLVAWWSAHATVCPLDHVLASYAYGLFVLSIPSMVTAVLAVLVASNVVFPIFAVLHIFDVWQIGTLFAVFTSWGVFCLVEDLWHVGSLRVASGRRAHHHESEEAKRKAGVAYATATAVGYATAQCVALMCIVTAIMEGHTAFELHEEHAASGEITTNEGGFLFVLTLFFTWYWLPLRLLASHLLALEVAREDAGKAVSENGAPPPQPSCCDAVCPAPAAGAGCFERFRGFWRVALWPWGLRTTHFALFLYLFLLLKNVFLVWLLVALVAGGGVMFVAWKRILVVENQLDPTLRATGLRELYGFSLLADSDESAETTRGAEVV